MACKGFYVHWLMQNVGIYTSIQKEKAAFTERCISYVEVVWKVVVALSLYVYFRQHLYSVLKDQESVHSCTVYEYFEFSQMALIFLFLPQIVLYFAFKYWQISSEQFCVSPNEVPLLEFDLILAADFSRLPYLVLTKGCCRLGPPVVAQLFIFPITIYQMFP